MTRLDSPYAKTMGFGSARDEEGRLLLTMAFETNKLGRPGFLHGGAIAGMLEAVAYQTLAEALGEEDRPRLKPINVTVTFLRGGRDHITYARATIERLGRRIANIDAVAWQDDPTKPIATAQMNVMLDRG
ncbi:MAG: PaaI family thioesterase [Pseudomonadota bacterium]